MAAQTLNPFAAINSLGSGILIIKWLVMILPSRRPEVRNER
jgi:hypothetical protein